jgi:hypothetical protein
MKAVMVAFLMEVTPMFPSIHPDNMISPFVFNEDISALCCFTPATGTIYEVLGVNNLNLLSSQANTICLPVSVNAIVSIILSQ